MASSFLLALLLQQHDPAVDSFQVHLELWRPTVRGRMTVDEALGFDFLDSDAPESGRFSFESDAGLGDPATAFRIRLDYAPDEALGFFVHYERSLWKGDQTLAEDEELGAGLTLPAGTDVESRLAYWAVETGVSGRATGSPFILGGDAGLSFCKLDLKSSTAVGDVRAGSGALGPVFRGRAAWPFLEILRVEVSAMVQIPLIAGMGRFELGARLGARWKSCTLEVGYLSVFGEDPSDEPNRISMAGTTLAFGLHF
jgi:hypothetical protein